MKYLIWIASLVIFAGCSNAYLEDGKYKGNPEDVTTYRILNSMDTTKTYYVFTESSTIYVIGTDSNMVEYKVDDKTYHAQAFILLAAIVIVALFMIGAILD